MIRVVMFDLGMTLINAQKRPFPHVKSALAAIASFRTSSGDPVASCLVSDYDLATDPITPAKIKKIFDRYLAMLDTTTLRSFFEPVDRRITLSTHAGVTKPDRKIFVKALERLGSAATLRDCLFITEDASHVAAVRTVLHMQTLQFGADFHDWSEAPGLIAYRIDPHHVVNTTVALKAHLSTKGVDVSDTKPAEELSRIHVTGRVWHPVTISDHPELDNVHVAVPVTGDVSRTGGGDFHVSASLVPSQDDIAETARFVRSLAVHGQIDFGKDASEATTHAIETDEQGTRKLVRKRFSAIS